MATSAPITPARTSMRMVTPLANRPLATREPRPPHRGDLVVANVLARRFDTAHDPPKLGAAIENARRLLDADTLDELDALDLELLDLAVAAMALMGRIRAAEPRLIPRRRSSFR